VNYKIIAQSKLNDFRAIVRLVESAEFEECIALHPNDQNVKAYITYGNVDALKGWIRSKLRAEIQDYTARQLRTLAASLGIPNYCGMHKAALLQSILRTQRAAKIKAITELVPLVETDINTVLE
jgi:hypothetical protein